MPLPAQTIPALDRQAYADARSILIAAGAPGVVRAEYTPRGGTAVAVNVAVLAATPAAADAPGRGGDAAPGPRGSRRVFNVELAALEPQPSADTLTAGGNVGALGGVRTLRAGDTLLVPGYAAAQPDQTDVLLSVIGGSIRQVGAVWHAEAAP